jgi:hypothetical protein
MDNFILSMCWQTPTFLHRNVLRLHLFLVWYAISVVLDRRHVSMLDFFKYSLLSLSQSIN